MLEGKHSEFMDVWQVIRQTYERQYIYENMNIAWIQGLFFACIRLEIDRFVGICALRSATYQSHRG